MSLYLDYVKRYESERAESTIKILSYLAVLKEWSMQVGKRGGKVWINSETGKKRYGKKPGKRDKKEQESEDNKASRVVIQHVLDKVKNGGILNAGEVKALADNLKAMSFAEVKAMRDAMSGVKVGRTKQDAIDGLVVKARSISSQRKADAKKPKIEEQPLEVMTDGQETVAQTGQDGGLGIGESAGLELGKPDGGNAVGATLDNESGSAPFRPSIRTVRAEYTKKGNLTLVPDELKQHLNADQQEGVALAIEAMGNHGGFLNNDGTGVGKSRQQLAIAQAFAKQGKKVLIVSPKQVTKADFKKGTFSGSFKNDSDAMGVPVKLNGGDLLTAGQVHLTTYEGIKKLADSVDGNTVVLWDESHYAKNPTSSRSKTAADINDKAQSVAFFTATPGDKAIHIEHLKRAGVFGTAGKKATFEKLGMELYDQHVGGGVYRKVWRVAKGVKPAEVVRRISGLFDQATKDGLMVKRELSMDGVGFNTDHIELTPQQLAEVKDVYDSAMKNTDGARGLALMAARMHQEHMKIPHMVEQVKRDLAEGRSPVVFAGRVNGVGEDDEDDNEVKEVLAKTGHSSPGTIPALKEALIKAGIAEADIAELHGSAKEKPEKSMERFQSGKAKIMLATIQSGGTGVNLDDTVGDRPRSVHIMTPPLTANDMAQAIGRVHRLKTKSASRVHAVLANTDIDRWNAQLLHDKFKLQGAISGGSIARGADLVQPVDLGVEIDPTPFNWGESLIDTGHYVPVPYAQKDQAAKFGGTVRKINGDWVTRFPSKDDHQKFLDSLPKPAPATAATAPRGPIHHGGNSHSFSKLQNGNWGIRVVGDAKAGDTVTVTRRDGKSETKTVKRVVWQSGAKDVTLAEI